MLNKVEIANLGSRHALGMDFGSKLTLVTGDADLHQRALLEAAWGCMTSWWVERKGAPPRRGPADPAEPAWAETVVTDSRMKTRRLRIDWDRERQRWTPDSQHAEQTTLLADADGGFHIWIGQNRKHMTAYHRVTRRQVWTGQPGASEAAAYAGGRTTTAFSEMLRTVVPQRYRDRYARPDNPADEIARERPTGGVGRMAALAFLASWADARTSDESRGAGMLLIVEEPELHLHPSWERETVTRLTGLEEHLDHTRLQLAVVTNSPLVAASAEPVFDPDTTRHWNVSIDKKTGTPHAESLSLYRRGTADSWLMSESFGLETARNAAAETAILHAKRLQLDERPDLAAATEIDRRLHAHLGDSDPFWPRWTYWMDKLRSTR